MILLLCVSTVVLCKNTRVRSSARGQFIYYIIINYNIIFYTSASPGVRCTPAVSIIFYVYHPERNPVATLGLRRWRLICIAAPLTI